MSKVRASLVQGGDHRAIVFNAPARRRRRTLRARRWGQPAGTAICALPAIRFWDSLTVGECHSLSEECNPAASPAGAPTRGALCKTFFVDFPVPANANEP